MHYAPIRWTFFSKFFLTVSRRFPDDRPLVRTIVLSKFQRTFPSLIPNWPPLPEPLVWIWKGRPLRRFRFRLSILFFENFHFFRKKFFDFQRTSLSPFNSPLLPKPLAWIWKGYPLRRFRLLLSISFFGKFSFFQKKVFFDFQRTYLPFSNLSALTEEARLNLERLPIRTNLKQSVNSFLYFFSRKHAETQNTKNHKLL